MAPRTIYHAMVYAVIAGASPHAACILRNLSSELSGRAFQFWIAIFYQARNVSGYFSVIFQLSSELSGNYQVTFHLYFSYQGHYQAGYQVTSHLNPSLTPTPSRAGHFGGEQLRLCLGVFLH